MKTIEEMRQEVFAWTKQSYAEKLFAGTSGNLSMYDPDSGIMTITPTSIPYETILPEDMVAMKLDGEVVDGHYAPSSEWRLHAEIYKAFPEAGAVVHSHSPYATAFAVAHQSIPVILIEMVPFLGGDVPLAEFAVPGTDAVGLNAVAAMQERPA
ncbi:MAG: class II aldolase/adducin family protein, partial [Solobacterium sp.]|nr:class II aldolase/adducin family protein [Solobacterium sp.]